ncbi:MAG: triose-phosphate isomerase [Taibaiella sp.]|nr:triose-phosphate isomerase [Taibaiella sp.]
MRKKIVAANWKMNLNLSEGAELINDLYNGMPELSEHRLVVVAPPFVHIGQAATQLATMDHVYLGAQNCHQEASGAYTGEVSASMLSSAEVQYVIIGHSERRQYFGEDNEMLAKKVNQVLANGMKVIFCCGESLEVRDAGTENAWVETQLREGLFHLGEEHFKNVVIAYEPIWAIGTGRTASAQQAQDMHAHIRSVLTSQFGAEVADGISILYGGSCKPSNAAELFACADVDGGLIGGASLKAEEFIGIVSAMLETEVA